MRRIKFYAERQPWRQGVSIHAAVKNENGEFSVAQPVVMTTTKAGELNQPFMVLETEEAQLLMDELWHCGLRPSEGTGSAGSLAATERHLEDMRRLVFKKDFQQIRKGGAA